VRDSVLSKYPEIQTALNPLAPFLTTDVSVSLQKQVDTKKANESDKQAIIDVATAFLQSKKLY
jgi:osmoprotectant transport system substrate-binding protein